VQGKMADGATTGKMSEDFTQCSDRV
jgi:hypothetical protein